ncbi:MAG: methylated-DNA--[protein]-cysteine S-methyltransferase [Pseudomonadota bacterium]
MQAGMQSPLGPISVTEVDGVITALHWHAGPAAESPLLVEAICQLTAYFDRRLTRFDLPLDFGTGFSEKVRRAMAAIPYGQTRQYGDLAREIGVPAQAIGQACGANPVPVLIPCHRILAAKGLGGFSAKGGVESKVFLLKLEGAASLLI